MTDASGGGATAPAPNPLGSFVRQAIDAAARHFLTGLGIWLVGRAMLLPSQQEQFVGVGASLLVAVSGYTWSLIQKRWARRVVQGAAAAPAHRVAP